jgi:glycosyltransferase involved in cell wall biosynthesis
MSVRAFRQRPLLVEQLGDIASRTVARSDASAQTAGRPLRILMVATEAPPVRSGIAAVVGYLQDGLQRRGHYVDVLAYPELGRLEFGDIRLSGLVFKLPRLLRRMKEYDVVHIHGATPTVSDLALLFLRRRGRYPVVIYTHHMDLAFASENVLTRMYNRLHARLSARADAVIATTQENLRLLGDRCQGVVVPLGVDVERFSTNGPKDTQFTVLFVGQFRPYKGVRVLLHAMSDVTGARLLVAGHGPEEQAYRSLTAALGLDVEFHVGVDDDQLRQLYRRAHAIVLPAISRREAFGLTLVEGMAAGCVPIASNLPGVREVVAQTGFLFPKGDPNALAGILHGLHDQPGLVEQIGECARDRAAAFDRELIISDHDRLVTGLAACQQLKNRLADRSKSLISALHACVADVADKLEADWTEIVLRLTQVGPYTVASTGPKKLSDHRQLRQASSLLAWYAVNAPDGRLVGPDDGPLHLGDAAISGGMPAAVVAPLTTKGKHLGALVAMRERPFAERDLDILTCFARQIASSLRKAGADESILTATDVLQPDTLGSHRSIVATSQR